MKKYDLEERTEKFSKDIIGLVKKIPRNQITNPIINQLMRSATSIGANYREANGAESRKDFLHKIAISKKESRETKYWLNLLAEAEVCLEDHIQVLEKESSEFILIFSAIIRSGNADS